MAEFHWASVKTSFNFSNEVMTEVESTDIKKKDGIAQVVVETLLWITSEINIGYCTKQHLL